MNNRPLPLPDPNSDSRLASVKLVWLLNLIPYLGLGYFYALGPKALNLMFILWIFEFITRAPVHVMVWIYFILSVLGSAHIINKDRSALKLRQTFYKEVDSVEPGTQIPMSESSEFSLSTLETKAKRAELALKRMSADENEKSKQATDTFEYKALAAEKTLRARNAQSTAESDAAINFAPPDAPPFSDEEPSADADPFATPSAVPSGSAPVKTDESLLNVSAGGSLSNIPKRALSDQSTVSIPASANGSLDYSQINNSYMDSVVSSAGSAASFGASAGSLEVEQMLKQEAASNATDLNIAQAGASLNSSVLDEAAVKVLLKQSDDSTDLAAAPFPVPAVSGQIAPSNYVHPASSPYSPPAGAQGSSPAALDMSVPEVSSQWNNMDTSVPEVSSQWNNANMSVPEVSSQWNNADTSVPEVSSQWNNADASVSDADTQLQKAEANVPEVSQWNNAEKNVTDVNTQLQNAETNVPDVSTQWNSAEKNVSDMNTLLQNAETTVPEVSSQWNSAETSVPDISSQWNNSDAIVPEVSTQWQSPESRCADGSTKWDGQMTSVPDVSTQVAQSGSSVPDVSSQLANSDQTVPDVVSQLAPSSSNVPSFGDFASPTFSFSFEDHLKTSFLPADPAAPSATTVANCPKCGALKNDSFSFCLACGQTFE